MANIRIKDLSTDSALSAGDYVVVDSASEGSRKFDLGTELTSLKEEISELGGGLSDDVKQALLQIASKVAYIDDDGATYYQDLYDALYPSYTVTNTLTGCTTSNAAASAIEGSAYSATITASSGYTLTGATVSITMGGTDITSTAYNNGTISIASVTGNLIITVTAVAVTLSSISAVYTQSGTVYDSDTLDSLKDDLVVTSHWSDSSTATVDSADYTLSGTLTAGTSTITVSFGGKTTTFTVTVTHNNAPLYTFDDLSNSQSGRSLQITNGNHIKMISTVNSKYMYARFTELAGAWSDKSSNPLFSLSPTDELSLTIKNITYSGNTTGGKFNYYLVNASADTNVRSANDISLPTGSTTVTDDTRTVEVGGEATASIGWIKFWLYRPVTFECDIELYVNGARYI